MSDATTPNEHETSHEGLIKTPKQLMVVVVLSFILPVSIIFLLAYFVSSATRPGAGSDAYKPEETAARLRPVGAVTVRDSSEAAALKTGQQVFTAQCAACHAAGVAGAPKPGDNAAWAPRIKSGYEALLHSALKGKGAMPPQGGAVSDVEIGRAVVYMANQSGANFAEPAAPAAASASEPAPAAQGGGQDAATAQAAAAIAAATGGASAEKAAAGGAAAGTAAGGAAGAAAVPALYTQSCQVCHGTGVAGAPKVGDKAAWAPRISMGVDQLTQIAIKGIGAMPPRGGTTASDAEIHAVVEYMVGQSK